MHLLKTIFVILGPYLEDSFHPGHNFATEKILSESTQRNLHTLECEEGKSGTQLETQIFDCKTKDHWRDGGGVKERLAKRNLERNAGWEEKEMKEKKN